MKIELWLPGKTSFKYLEEGIRDYTSRLKKMTDFELIVFPDIKTKDIHTLQKKEAKQILDRLKPDNQLILLDEKGKEFSSLQFAADIEKRQMLQQKKIIFLIGGAYGFDETVYQRADFILSVSKMTLPHQLVRLVFLEQLYRAFTIIKGLPYHHE